MLTEAEVEEIRKGVAEGLRGPVILKWVEQLLEDHARCRTALSNAGPLPRRALEIPPVGLAEATTRHSTFSTRTHGGSAPFLGGTP